MAICPECGSSRTQSAGASGFQFVSNHPCLDCQAAWTPSCAKWAAVVSVLLGLPIALLGLWFVGAMAHSLVWNGFSMPGLFNLVVSLVGSWLEVTLPGFPPACQQAISSTHVQRVVMPQWD